MKKAPIVSVVMPLYNKAESVVSSIASVQAQSFRDWELIIINDGSTDSGPELASQVKDLRIRIFDQKNCGVSAARNRGIGLARSDLIAFLDADDQWSSNFLSKIISLRVDFPDAQWFSTGYEIRHHRYGVFNCRIKNIPIGFTRGILTNYFMVAANSDPPVISSGVAVLKSLIIKVGCFPEGVGSGEDLMTWAKLAVNSPLAYDKTCCVKFNVSGIDRRADPEQHVAKALINLHASNPGLIGLKEYVGFWFRTQAVMALRYKDVCLARRFSWKALVHGPKQWRNYYTCLLAWLPPELSSKLDKFLRSIVRNT